jgi:general stress protein 26
MDWDELVALIADAGPATIATAGADGAPHVSVAATIAVGDELHFFTLATSGKARNLRANPRLALLWRPQGEVYVWADALLTDDVEAKRELWGSGRLPYEPAGFFGAADNPELVLVRAQPVRATAIVAGPDGLARLRWRR